MRVLSRRAAAGHPGEASAVVAVAAEEAVNRESPESQERATSRSEAEKVGFVKSTLLLRVITIPALCVSFFPLLFLDSHCYSCRGKGKIKKRQIFLMTDSELFMVLLILLLPGNPFFTCGVHLSSP